MKKEVLYTKQVLSFIASLHPKTQDRMLATFKILEENGRLIRPMGEKVEGQTGLFELRIKDADGQYRIFYVYAKDSIIWALWGFKKTSAKTPLAEIKNAQRVRKELGL